MYLVVLSMCVSLMANDSEHLFITQYLSYLFGECLFKPSARFLTGFLFSFLLLSYRNSLCILDVNPLSDV